MSGGTVSGRLVDTALFLHFTLNGEEKKEAAKPEAVSQKKKYRRNKERHSLPVLPPIESQSQPSRRKYAEGWLFLVRCYFYGWIPWKSKSHSRLSV